LISVNLIISDFYSERVKTNKTRLSSRDQICYNRTKLNIISLLNNFLFFLAVRSLCTLVDNESTSLY
jgi:hypothetical protein